MTWKDWVTAVGMALTLATVMVQGGRLVERQEAANKQLTELTGQIQQIRAELAQGQRDLVAQRGVDALHDEQIRSLRRDVDSLSTLNRNKP